MKQNRLNNDEILRRMMDIAEENGFSLVVNGTEGKEVHLILYPFRETIVSQEEIARHLFEIMAESGVTNTEKSFREFKEDVEPDDFEDHIFTGASTDKSKNETRISVFHNKNIMLKYIGIRLC